MRLSEQDRMRYARHLLLPQLGEAGQARLLAARVRPSLDADPGALAVARSYLARAGVQVVDEADAPELVLGGPSALARVAGRPELLEAARALVGALAAVQAIQTAAELGQPSSLPALFAISSEEA